MLLYGASGHAKVIIDTLAKEGNEVDFIFDDNPNIKELSSLKVISKYDSRLHADSEIIISIGDNRIRKQIAGRVEHPFGKVIHPNAVIANYVKINKGTVVFANSVIQSSVRIGNHVIINTKASVDHDCSIGDFVHIAPGVTVCGGVVIGEGTLIGAGAIILPNIKIGKWSVIGAGAVVTKDIGDNETWVGNPAKKVK